MAVADPPIAPSDVLGYWFCDPPFDATAAMPWMRRWFQGGPEVDREIVARFAAAVGAAIMERFGRFPHRNEILGRVSTPEEEAFLVDWTEKQPPRAMAPER